MLETESAYLCYREMSENEFDQFMDYWKDASPKAKDSLGIGENPSFDGKKGFSVLRALGAYTAGIPVATLFDLEQARETGMPMNEKYFCSSSVIFYSRDLIDSPNAPFLKNLAKLVKLPLKSKIPRIFEGLSLTEEDNEYGLNFALDSKPRIIRAKDFVFANHQKKFRKINPDYTLDGLGDRDATRTLYLRKQGLARLSLVHGLSLHAQGESLSGHSEICRGVCVEGRTPDLVNRYFI